MNVLVFGKCSSWSLERIWVMEILENSTTVVEHTLFSYSTVTENT